LKAQVFAFRVFQSPRPPDYKFLTLKNPAPMRELSLVVHRHFVKQRLKEALKKEILNAIPEKIRQNKNQNIVSINL
jgi:hypothetical protein